MKKKADIHISKNLKDTAVLAGVVLKRITKDKRPTAAVLALQGDLGCGKTAFVQAFLKIAGVKGRVTSPTFVVMKRYVIPRHPLFKRAYHIDAYRVDEEAMQALDLDTILADKEAVVCIEWADRIEGILPEGTLWIQCEHGQDEKERQFTIN